MADRLTAETPNAYCPDQYSNPENPQAHHDQTGPEIWEQTDGEIGVLAIGLGSGGTVTGAGRYLKEMKPDLLVVGVDPEGSIYTAASEDDVTTYLTEGIFSDGSSGMAVAGALRVARRQPEDLVVVVLPDSGRNYISKIYRDDWLSENGFG